MKEGHPFFKNSTKKNQELFKELFDIQKKIKRWWKQGAIVGIAGWAKSISAILAVSLSIRQAVRVDIAIEQ